MQSRSKHRLSKSKFNSGLQCHKLLSWQIHEPDATELVPDASLQFIFDQGYEVGRLAQTYVPGGVLTDLPHEARERRLRETAAALKNGGTVLYEPGSSRENGYVEYLNGEFRDLLLNGELY